MSTMDEIFDGDDGVPPAGSSPCGCNGAKSGLDDGALADLDAALDSLSADDLGSDADVDLEALERALAEVEGGMALDDMGDESGGGRLDDLVGWLERYPGLKVTLGF